MKPVSKRIEPVKKVVQQREKKAADALTQAQQSFGQAQQKLSELVQYRIDYIAEFQYRAQKGMSGSQIQHYKQFLAQLDKAIAMQEQRLNELQSIVQRQRKEWQSTNQRTQAIHQYQTRLQKKELINKEKREARQLEDDVNSRRTGVKGQ
jgi:flagellar FliJ protein